MGAVVELVLIVVVALGLALGIQAFLVKPYRIPSGSMLPTLSIGQRVLVNRIGHSFSKPAIGDIVVFHPPKDATSMTCGVEPAPETPCPTPETQRSDTNFIKRIVAGPGDTLAIKDGHAIVNGVPAKEPFIRPCAPGRRECNFPKPITIPADHYFMMGDNRGESDDSRYWGPVPDKWIIGGAFATYWPPKRIGIF
ncbi:MAG: signal peptidase [Solirubrobacteraceae bacterium]|nr:signal peptidase [Solirubrobacteraceae bacterium]